jgi:predicted transcriptional regulator
MNLREYFEETGTSVVNFAKKAGVSKLTIHNLLGGRDVRMSIAVKIQRATKGKVKCEDLYEEILSLKKNKK